MADKIEKTEAKMRGALKHAKANIMDDVKDPDIKGVHESHRVPAREDLQQVLGDFERALL